MREAVKCENYNVIQYLIKINKLNEGSWRARHIKKGVLLLAVKMNDDKMVEYLINSGFGVETNEKILIEAVKNNNLTIVLKLIENGADVHENFNSAIKLAIKNNNFKR